MYNHVDNRWIKAFLTKIISILLVYSLFFTSTANAANVGGWTLGGGVAQGASTVYEGTKKVVIDGVDYIKKGTAKITPTAASVAKTLGKGVAGVAVSVAVEQLLGAVDWVLDPANNQIKYRITSPNDPVNYQYMWSWDYERPQFNCYSASTCVSAGNARQQYLVSAGLNDPSSKITYTQCNASGTNFYCTGKYPSGSDRSDTLARLSNPAYDPNADSEEKTIPLDVVAQKVISNAAGGDASAQAATTAAAADIVAEAEKDDAKARPIAQQLQASATTKPADEAAAEKANEATGEAKPNTANPEATDLSIEFPVFCGWAPLVCEAAQVVISFPTTITEIWTAAEEWAKNDENEDTDNDPPEIQEIDIGALDTSTFKGVAGCPAPIQVPITFGTGGETEISYEPICQLADKWSFVAPLIGFLSGAMILVGVGRKGEDGEI